MRRAKDPHGKLWRRYKQTNCRRLRDQLVEAYLPLVKGEARRVSSRLPNTVDPEDLASAGVCGLLKAIDRYDPGRGTRFEIYCRMRVKGSMLDELRNQDWIPREARSREAHLNKTESRLRDCLGREPSEEELAAALDISVKTLRTVMFNLTFSGIVSLTTAEMDHQVGYGNRSNGDSLPSIKEDPCEIVHRQEITVLVYSSLTLIEKMIIMLYYHQGMTMREIGEILDISESRVCQIHARMLLRLKERYSAEY